MLSLILPDHFWQKESAWRMKLAEISIALIVEIANYTTFKQTITPK